MAASQNVLAAIKGGPVGIVAGLLAVLCAFALVPVISRFTGSDPKPEDED